ncbi:hypothetical protein X777_05517 [Ooceraea biroi]|uniref:Uncharacterized protein n=1 Tax=Ooceraea biroi TaxID=2015173 RepID=A0A026WF01_OOCBI|nr:hypothetical protein X777_05517 [Ooceraea biroi]
MFLARPNYALRAFIRSSREQRVSSHLDTSPMSAVTTEASSRTNRTKCSNEFTDDCKRWQMMTVDDSESRKLPTIEHLKRKKEACGR